MPDDDPGQVQEPTPNEERFVRMKREDIQALEASAAKAKDVDKLQRELVMTKAGVNTESPLGKMFFSAYDGELTKEAVQAAAQEVGLLEVTTPPPELTQEEKGATQERQMAANGAAQPDTNPQHPKDEAIEKAKSIVQEGGTYEQAGAGYISTLVQRHAQGDQRATHDPRRRE